MKSGMLGGGDERRGFVRDEGAGAKAIRLTGCVVDSGSDYNGAAMLHSV